MMRQVVDAGDERQIWKVAANILNWQKQSRTADRGRPSSLGVGQGANNSHRQKSFVTKRPVGPKERDHLDDRGVDGMRLDLREIGVGCVEWI
jgi:hypothetical protein